MGTLRLAGIETGSSGDEQSVGLVLRISRDSVHLGDPGGKIDRLSVETDTDEDLTTGHVLGSRRS